MSNLSKGLSTITGLKWWTGPVDAVFALHLGSLQSLDRTSGLDWWTDILVFINGTHNSLCADLKWKTNVTTVMRVFFVLSVQHGMHVVVSCSFTVRFQCF